MNNATKDNKSLLWNNNVNDSLIEVVGREITKISSSKKEIECMWRKSIILICNTLISMKYDCIWGELLCLDHLVGMNCFFALPTYCESSSLSGLLIWILFLVGGHLCTNLSSLMSSD